MDINTNRVVEIHKGSTSWRYFGPSFLKPADGRSFFTSSTPTSVNPKVSLLMDTGTPKYSTFNEYSAGLGDLVNAGARTIDGLFGTTKLGSALSGVGATLTGVISMGVDAGVSIAKGEGASFNPWWLDAPTWSGTQNTMTFDYTFNFAMGQYGLWDAKEEVVKPVLSLAIPSMIRNISNNTMTGPGPRTYNLITSAFDFEDTEGFKDFLSGLAGGNILNKAKDYLYTFKFGTFLTLNNVLVKNTDMNFSSEVDTNGMPITGTIVLHCATYVPQAISADSEELLSMRFHI